MNGPRIPAGPSGAPAGDPGGPPGPERIAVGRAALLIAVALVLGILLIRVGNQGGGAPAAAPSTSTTTTAPHPTTTTVAAPNPSVKVLVANGSTTTGAAGFFTNKLKSQGWTTLAPTTAPKVTASAVYYASGQQKSADEVASALGIKSTAVQPLPSSIGVTGATAAGVVVVVGPDISTQVTSTTTTTAAPVTSATTTGSSTTAPATTAGSATASSGT